jgi:hypothetical protein
MTIIFVAYAILAAAAWWLGGTVGVATLAILTGLSALAIIVLAQVIEAGDDRRQRRIALARLAEWERERR